MCIFSVSSWKKNTKKNIRQLKIYLWDNKDIGLDIHKCFCSILYSFTTFTSNTFLPSLTLSASIHARLSRLGNYTAGFMLQYNFLCRWNRRKNVKTFLDPIQTAWKFIALRKTNIRSWSMKFQIQLKFRYCEKTTKFPIVFSNVKTKWEIFKKCCLLSICIWTLIF